jgi:hypothetical protein
MKSSKAIRLLIPVSLLCAIVLSLKSFVVHVLAWPGMYYMQHEKWKDVANQNLQPDIERNFLTALAVAPQNIELNEAYGDFLSIKRVDTQEQYAAARKQAQEIFRKSYQALPFRAYPWSRFAVNKAAVREFDDEFSEAYKKSFELGGREFRINQELVHIGLNYFRYLDGSTRLVLKQSLQNQYQANAQNTLITAMMYRQLHMACIWVRQLPEKFKMCTDRDIIQD